MPGRDSAENCGGSAVCVLVGDAYKMVDVPVVVHAWCYAGDVGLTTMIWMETRLAATLLRRLAALMPRLAGAGPASGTNRGTDRGCAFASDLEG